MRRMIVVMLLALLAACTPETPLVITTSTPAPTPLPSPSPLPPVEAPTALPGGALSRLGRGTIRTMALSTDGTLIAVGGSLGVYLYEAATFDLLWFAPSTNTVEAVAISDQYVASSARSSTITLHHRDDGTPALTLAAGQQPVVEVVFNPAGDALAALTTTQLTVWDLPAGSQRGTVSHEDVLKHIEWGDDLLTIGGGGITAWTFDGQPRSTLLASDVGRGFRLASGGMQTAVGQISGAVYLWNADQPQQTRPAHDLWVRSIAVSPDGTRAASAGQRGEIAVWDTTTGQRIQAWDAHPDRAVVDVAFAPDGLTLYSAAFDDRLVQWDATTGQQIAILDAHTRPLGAVAWSPDGQIIASADLAGGVTLWDVDSGQVLHTLDRHTNQVKTLAFTEDYLLTGGLDATLIAWDPASGRPQAILDQHNFAITAVYWQGDRMVTGDEGGRAILWDLATLEPLQTFQGHANSLYSVYLTDDTLRTGSLDGTAIEWDLQTGQRLDRFLFAGISHLDYTPDGQTVIASPWFDYIQIYPWGSNAPTTDIPPATGVRFGMDLSPDGRYVASGSEEGQIVVYDVAAAEVVTAYDGHTGDVTGVVFAPSSDRFATVSWDGSIIVWPVAP